MHVLAIAAQTCEVAWRQHMHVRLQYVHAEHAPADVRTRSSGVYVPC